MKDKKIAFFVILTALLFIIFSIFTATSYYPNSNNDPIYKFVDFILFTANYAHTLLFLIIILCIGIFLFLFIDDNRIKSVINKIKNSKIG
ncbi:hypothetical protein [Gillisia sp. JM1]|uniref:hypothetical protein n=1 Tax=Gillisia sp. JM1 TaxID=1283286 RepID=UPI00041509EE|nr:hypothetical protein [Gillisia sp. JM1]